MDRSALLRPAATAVAATLLVGVAPAVAAGSPGFGDLPGSDRRETAESERSREDGDPVPESPQVYEGSLAPDELALVRAAGLDYEDVALGPAATDGSVPAEVIMGAETAEALAEEGVALDLKTSVATLRSTAEAQEATGVFRPWSGEGNLREEFLAVAEQYDRLTEVVTIGQSVQGQDILAIRVTDDADRVRDGRRPAVLYVSAQHAREWITPEMTRRLLLHYLEGYGTDRAITEILDTTELWFVPVANPDGYDYTFTPGNRLWRKNLADNNGDGVITGADGVDPNRNFDYRWGYDNEGSSPVPSSAVYRGPSGNSEPETQALDGLMDRIDFEYLLNYHSAAELILYGLGWQVATPSPDDLIYATLAGDDAQPAVPGYDPDISAELYTTNGDTDTYASEVHGVLGFTPEMSTCQTVSALDPADAFEPDACQSVFNFPDSEPLVQAEFEKNLAFALSVARSAPDPDNPVSVTGEVVPDFDVDTFDVSYGTRQQVATVARRDLRGLVARYRVDDGRVRTAPVRLFRGGERYGDEGDIYYAEYRAQISARVGSEVEVWFTGTRGQRRDRERVESERFTYTVAGRGREDVLVVADEDYTGVNPVYPAGTTAPTYAQAYVDALDAEGISAQVWDVDAQGVPHDLGVLDHFDAVLWYSGDDRLTQDPDDELTSTPFGDLEDLSVAEQEQYLTLAMRDYLNEGGKLLVTGETAGYTGQLGQALGGIYYGLDGAPEEDCVVTGDFFADCLLLADDFFQYYLGAYDRTPALAGTSRVVGLDDILAGVDAELGSDLAATNPLDEAGAFTPTSEVLPPSEFPWFGLSRPLALYESIGQNPYAPVEGSRYAGVLHADDGYARLTRTVDLTGVAAGADAQLQAQLSYSTEGGYDHVVVEARTAGGEDWTTLPEVGGGTSTDVPTECEAGFLLALHPFLARYLTLPPEGGACAATGTTGAWNSFTGDSGGWVDVAFDLSAYAGQQVEVSVTYVTDPGTGGIGVFLDDTRVVVDGAVAESEGFESGLGAWSVPGAPAGSPGNTTDWADSEGLVAPGRAGVATEDTVLLGFGIEQLADPAVRQDVLGRAMGYLLSSPR